MFSKAEMDRITRSLNELGSIPSSPQFNFLSREQYHAMTYGANIEKTLESEDVTQFYTSEKNNTIIARLSIQCSDVESPGDEVKFGTPFTTFDAYVDTETLQVLISQYRQDPLKFFDALTRYGLVFSIDTNGYLIKNCGGKDIRFPGEAPPEELVWLSPDQPSPCDRHLWLDAARQIESADRSMSLQQIRDDISRHVEQNNFLRMLEMSRLQITKKLNDAIFCAINAFFEHIDAEKPRMLSDNAISLTGALCNLDRMRHGAVAVEVSVNIDERHCRTPEARSWLKAVAPFRVRIAENLKNMDPATFEFSGVSGVTPFTIKNICELIAMHTLLPDRYHDREMMQEHMTEFAIDTLRNETGPDGISNIFSFSKNLPTESLWHIYTQKKDVDIPENPDGLTRAFLARVGHPVLQMCRAGRSDYDIVSGALQANLSLGEMVEIFPHAEYSLVEMFKNAAKVSETLGMDEETEEIYEALSFICEHCGYSGISDRDAARKIAEIKNRQMPSNAFNGPSF